MVTGLGRWCLAGALGLALLGPPAAAQSPEELYEQGNTAYGEGRYADATAAYEAILRYRIVDPRVEYNLGNAHFKLGNLGLAVLHFERARALDPADEEIALNLAYAKSFCFDRVDPPEMPAMFRAIARAQDRLGADRQLGAALALYWLIAAVAAWGASSPGRWRPAYGWTLAGLVVLLALVAGSWWATLDRHDGQRAAVVLSPAVDVLAGPGRLNPALATVHEGLTIELREEQDDWIKVGLPNGLSGWLPRESLGIVR